jgi:choline dehydrogenase-like flavoprotein
MTAIPLDFVPQDPEDHLWDAIIIGTGAGGATAGFNLARLGRSVLFVERGKLLHHDPAVVRGKPYTWKADQETALNHGWWPRHIYFREAEDAAEAPIRPPIGSGAGGTTSQFGAVMDRFRPEDFTPRQFYPDVPQASLPEAWPVGYEEMVPFYERAESLFRVRGTPDPLGPPQRDLLEPPPASERERAVVAALQGVGLNPYRLHSARERVPGCIGCPAMLCPHPCRNDAARICLYPALEQYGAKILPNCRALRLEEKSRAIERVICDWGGRQISLRARIVIVAANAFLTPVLLQRSGNERFPDGLANSSGLVGRNLMLHAHSHLFTRLKRPAPELGFYLNHGLSLNDFYIHDGTKLGNIHAHTIATRDELMRFLIQYYLLPNMGGGGSGSRRWAAYLPGRLLAMIASMGTFLCRSWTVFAAIVEDLPYPGNFVSAKHGSDEDVVFTYRYPDELGRRARLMCDAFIGTVSPQFDAWHLQPAGVLNNSHVCGTCRFGDDPRTSVLDRDNRAHDLDNLYVLDASFFPSSGGINPSLTIVANSLRATDKIAQRL